MIGRMRWQPPIRRVVISGPSMLPTLQPGEWWVARMGRPRIGEIVLLRDPQEFQRWLVKRIDRRSGAGWWVTGDNVEASRDSREFGPVDPKLIFGPLWWRYPPRPRPRVFD